MFLMGNASSCLDWHLYAARLNDREPCATPLQLTSSGYYHTVVMDTVQVIRPLFTYNDGDTELARGGVMDTCTSSGHQHFVWPHPPVPYAICSVLKALGTDTSTGQRQDCHLRMPHPHHSPSAPVTSGDWLVFDSKVCINWKENILFFMGNASSCLDWHLYAARLNTREPCATPLQLTSSTLLSWILLVVVVWCGEGCLPSPSLSPSCS